MNKLTVEKRAAIVRGLCEGNSVRAMARMTSSGKGTILRLVRDVGDFCAFYQDVAFRHLKCARVEADEIWGILRSEAAEREAGRPR